MEFNNINELKERLMPALRSKLKELHLNKMHYINIDDIWQYLKEYKWKTSEGLTLSTMVDDILNTDNDYIDDYVKDRIINERVETSNEIL